MSLNKSRKHRYQISLSPAAAQAGKRLAKQERRNFSNLLEVLIDRATGRLGKTPEAAARKLVILAAVFLLLNFYQFAVNVFALRNLHAQGHELDRMHTTKLAGK